MLALSTRVTRREVLKIGATSVAAPYVITSTALGADGRQPASDRIVTALIGSGSRGQQIMAGGDQVVAVCDVDAKHCEAAKARIDAAAGNRDCAAYSDFREVLARDDIDAVVVATPDHWHVPIAAAAIRAGKPVYVEKPLSLYIREGRALAGLVDRYNAILQVGTQQRSYEYEKFRRVCELVRNGYIGQLHTVQVDIITRLGSDKPWKPQAVPPELDYEMWLGPAPWAPYHPDRVHYKFRFVSDYSGGDMTNWGAHHLDIAQWGIGADDYGPYEVVGHGKRNATGLHDVFADVHVDFKFEGGVTVQLRSTSERGTGKVRFVGSEGWVEVSREKYSSQPASLVDVRLRPNDVRLGSEDEQTSHMGNWLNCVRSRNARGLNTPVEIGHRSASLCHLANIAMELGRPLRWDPVTEQFIDDKQANRMCHRAARPPWDHG